MRHAPAPQLAAALAAAAVLAGCDQPFLSARVEIPEVRIVEPAKTFPAAAIDPAAACSTLVALTGRTCAAQTASYDLGGEVPGLSEKGVKVDLRLTDVALHLAAGGASNLGGVTRAEVDLRDASGGVTRVASYVRPPGATPTSIAVSGSSNLELSPYLQDGKLDARVEVEMDPLMLPSGFTASIEAGFSVIVTVDYRSL
jgi:hypothetical protein